MNGGARSCSPLVVRESLSNAKGTASLDSIGWLRELTETTPVLWQWTVIFFAGAIPFVESYFAGPLGIVAGMNPVVAIIAGILGNITSMAMVAFGASQRAVIIWQTISIILWGVAFSALALLGVNAFIPVGG